MNQFQSFEEVVAAFWRRAWLIVAVALLGSAASVWLALNQKTLYQATAVVQIEDARIPERLTSSAGTAAPGEESRRVRLIEQRLMARDNLLALMEQYRLFEDEETINERVYALRQAVTLEEIRGNAQPWQTDVAPSGLRISVRLGEAEKAAAVANDLMTAVIRQARERGLARARDTFAFFDDEVARITAEIDAAETAVAEFKQANADTLPAGATVLRDQIAGYRESLLALDQEVVRLRAGADRLREEDLARQIALIEEQKALIETRLGELQTLLGRAPGVERALSGLERELDQLQEQYAVITRRKAEAEMGQILQDREEAERFEVLETALVPEVPISRSRKKVAFAGGVASLIAGVLLALALEILNPAIRNAAQLERRLGVQPVITVPPIRTRGDRARRRLLYLGSVAALAALGFAAMRTLGGAVSDLGILDRLLLRHPGS
ncbi:GumC family protein [Roseivivax sp. CAU 1761]